MSRIGAKGWTAGTARLQTVKIETRNAALYQALICGVRDYVNKNGFKGVLIGMSGGIDSALSAAVAVDALGPTGCIA